MKINTVSGGIDKLNDPVIDACYDDVTGELKLVRRSGKKSLVKGFSISSVEVEPPVFSDTDEFQI